MAKGTKANGDTYTDEEISDIDAPIRIRRAELGRVDQPCQTVTDGTDSSPSSKTPEQSRPETESSGQEPANAGNLSEQPPEETDSTAQTTDTDTPKTDPASPRKPPARARRTGTRAKTSDTKQARASAIGPEDDFE